MAKKRIHNPKTKRYMSIRQKTTSKGRKGQIIGGYSKKTASKVSKEFGRAIKKLSNK